PAAGRAPPPQAALPTIYAITPTYSRPVQKAELTRLANTFRQVARLHWILVEDAAARSELEVRAGGPGGSRHGPPLSRPLRPAAPRLAWGARFASPPARGLCRLSWPAPSFPPTLKKKSTRKTCVQSPCACLLQMRTTRKVSVWPVGLVGGRRYERPVVENGKVVGWYTGWRADRPFAIDMAGFAVSLQVILSHPKAVFKRRGSQPGMQESDFLKQITTVEELEPKANNCTKVLVWHTRTEKVNLANEPKYHLDTVSIEV
ncbi:B3GA2 glucuronosyltransferase, partial [Arenaria interpres]|nr:B3GA2 glucuronosyltransferase [Arenaria interpres]